MNQAPDHARQLKQFLLFSGLDNTSLVRLARLAKPIKAKKGVILFTEGDEASSLFCLVSGRIDLIKSSPDGREQLVRAVEAGEVFAEAAVFFGSQYPVTATAKSSSELIAISKKEFREFIKAHPDVSLKMMGAMAGLLRHLNNLLGDLRLSSAESRLAAYLIKRAESVNRTGFDLDMKKNELAFRLGTTGETLSRNLSRFKKDRLIKVSGRKIQILDIEKLRDLANL